jgi:hypothetical protein
MLAEEEEKNYFMACVSSYFLLGECDEQSRKVTASPIVMGGIFRWAFGAGLWRIGRPCWCGYGYCRGWVKPELGAGSGAGVTCNCQVVAFFK